MRKPVSIAYFGVDDPVRQLLHRLSESVAFSSLSLLEEVSDTGFAHEADCLIFDITDPLANRKWRLFRAGKRISAVIIIAQGAVSLPPRLQARAVVLQKPLHPTALAWGLRKLLRIWAFDGERPTESTASASVTGGYAHLSRLHLLRAAEWLHGDREKIEFRYASMDELSASDSDGLARASFEPDEYLYGYLRSALKAHGDASHAFVVRLPGGFISLVPFTGMVTILMEDTQLQELCAKRLSHFESPPVVRGTESLEEAGEHLPRRQASIESLLWLAALRASHGRFPASLDITVPRRLLRWPNLSRLADAPYAARISALWAARTMTAFEIADELDIHQRHVFSFASAAQALDLFPEGDGEVERAVADGRWLGRRLFSGARVLTHLLRNGQ